MTADSFEEFSDAVRDAGFDEVIEKEWAPNVEISLHSHDFDAQALVIKGEMWLTREGVTEHLGIGDTFSLTNGTPHTERYGPEGATYWVGRKKP